MGNIFRMRGDTPNISLSSRRGSSSRPPPYSSRIDDGPVHVIQPFSSKCPLTVLKILCVRPFTWSRWRNLSKVVASGADPRLRSILLPSASSTLAKGGWGKSPRELLFVLEVRFLSLFREPNKLAPCLLIRRQFSCEIMGEVSLCHLRKPVFVPILVRRAPSRRIAHPKFYKLRRAYRYVINYSPVATFRSLLQAF